MAYNPNEQYKESALLGSGLRFFPEGNSVPKTFAAGSGTLAPGTPVSFNTSTNKWVVWGAAVSEVSTITSHATPATAGTFTITVDGEVSGAIAFDATAAIIQTALRAMAGINNEDVSVAATTGVDLGDASSVVTITWAGKFAGAAPVVSIQTGSLTGNAHVLAEATAGVAANGTNLIKGFIWPNPVVLDSDEEVLGVVMLMGRAHYDDIVLPAGQTADGLKAALRDGPRALGLKIEGLDQVR